MPVSVLEKNEKKKTLSTARVYCALCTRTVEASVAAEPNLVYRKASLRVIAGQKCPRCSASLDAAFVLGPSN